MFERVLRIWLPFQMARQEFSGTATAVYQCPLRPSTVAGSLLPAYGFGGPAWLASILSASPVSLLQVLFLLGYELPEGTPFGPIPWVVINLRCSYCSVPDVEQLP